MVPSATTRTSARRNVSSLTWTESNPWTFTGNADGLYPQAPLLRDASGALYGENEGCNVAACYNGLVFKLTPPAPGQTAWTDTNLYGFPSTNTALGNFPQGGLIMDRRGALYGTTENGGTGCGTYGCGVVFKLSPPAAGQTAWTETVLHTFTGVNGDGALPYSGGLVMDERGTLYGTTLEGGNTTLALCANQAPFPGCGTVFALTPPPAGKTTWTESVIHTFTGVNGDGIDPESDVVLDDCGNLYGTTHFGGVGPGFGTVYKLARPAYGRAGWTETVLHAFSGGLDGNGPDGGLTLYRGAVYGTASGGGANGVTYGGYGVAFRLTPSSASWNANWTETVLHNFGTGPDDGERPDTGFIVDNGALYGTTSGGGPSGAGTVFKLSPPMYGQTAWTEAVLYAFSGGADGDYLVEPLTAGGRGVLFGTTEFGGSAPFNNGNGVVFELKE